MGLWSFISNWRDCHELSGMGLGSRLLVWHIPVGPLALFPTQTAWFVTDLQLEARLSQTVSGFAYLALPCTNTGTAAICKRYIALPAESGEGGCMITEGEAAELETDLPVGRGNP